eukprot:scaffold32809_cov19-Tisochrysis_lutea.AAC.1
MEGVKAQWMTYYLGFFGLNHETEGGLEPSIPISVGPILQEVDIFHLCCCGALELGCGGDGLWLGLKAMGVPWLDGLGREYELHCMLDRLLMTGGLSKGGKGPWSTIRYQEAKIPGPGVP